MEHDRKLCPGTTISTEPLDPFKNAPDVTQGNGSWV